MEKVSCRDINSAEEDCCFFAVPQQSPSFPRRRRVPDWWTSQRWDQSVATPHRSSGTSSTWQRKQILYGTRQRKPTDGPADNGTCRAEELGKEAHLSLCPEHASADPFPVAYVALLRIFSAATSMASKSSSCRRAHSLMRSFSLKLGFTMIQFRIEAPDKGQISLPTAQSKKKLSQTVHLGLRRLIEAKAKFPVHS